MLHVKGEKCHQQVNQNAKNNQYRIDHYLDKQAEIKELLEKIANDHRIITQEFSHQARLEAFSTRNLIRMIKGLCKLNMTAQHFVRIAALALEGIHNVKDSGINHDVDRHKDASFGE